MNDRQSTLANNLSPDTIGPNFHIDFKLSLVLISLALFEAVSLLTLSTNFASIILAIGLLASLHHVHTFVLIFSLPEGKALLKNWFGSNGFVPIFILSTVFLGLYFLTKLIFGQLIASQSINAQTLLFLQLFIDGFIAFHHMIRQSLALSSSFDHENVSSNSPAFSESFRRIRSFERLIGGLTTALMFLMLVSLVIWNNRVYVLMCSSLVVLSVLSLWAIQVFNPNRPRKKFLFLVRTLLWPFYGWTIIGTAGCKIQHAIESQRVFNRVAALSNLTVRRRLWICSIALAIPYLALILFNSRGAFFSVFTIHNPFEWWSREILPIYLSLALMHVFIESFIFKLRFTSVRQTIGRFFIFHLRPGQ